MQEFLNLIFFTNIALTYQKHIPVKRENLPNLLKLLKKGDMAAFDTIYEKYSKRLYAFVFRYLKQEEDTEEIVQEVFLKLWECRKNIDLHASFDSYLFTIAYNTTITLLRKKVNEKKYQEYLINRQLINDADEIINEIHFREVNIQVKSLLDELTPRQKEVFLLSREEGLTHAEIAEKLHISANTVKNHIVTALSFLKSRIPDGSFSILLFIYLFL